MSSEHCLFDSLPNEIIELIFSNVPIIDLLRVCSLVCTRWRDVIRNPGFVPWKKAYYNFKLLNQVDDDDSEPPTKRSRQDSSEKAIAGKLSHFLEEVRRPTFVLSNSVMTDESCLNVGDSLERLIPSLIKFSASEFRSVSKRFQLIQRHPEARYGALWLDRMMPELGERNVALVVLLCAIAKNAWDVKRIFDILLAPTIGATCSSLDASELLYFVALAFLEFHRNRKFPIRFHHNVFQAIYYFETSLSGGLAPKPGPVSPRRGQLSLMNFGFSKTMVDFRLTSEQTRIIQHPLRRNVADVIKIVAFAGSGKTTTLVNLCKENPSLKFLVVMYNRSVRLVAEKIFPKNNVKCVTAHSVAFQKCGFMFQNKLTPNLKPLDIIDSGVIEEIDSDRNSKSSSQQRAAQVLKTIENFMNSSDEAIDMENVPSCWIDYSREEELPLSVKERAWILQSARNVWEAMTNKADMRIRIPHDGYLKVYQLRKPDLQQVWQHDVLLIDEAQDMNPAMLNIFMGQKTSKVLVGDPNQQIYLFRGAINALESLEATHTYYLTQSFRFGPEIAFAADAFLVRMKNVTRQTLVGGLKADFIVSRSMIDAKSREFKPVAVIGRSNIGVFNEVVNLVCDVDPLHRPTAAFAGGFESYNFKDYLDIYYLSIGKNELMKKWKKFRDYKSFRKFAQNTNDPELLSKIEVVDCYKDRLPEIVRKIDRFCQHDPKTADYVFTTVHKSKGLEWPSVILLHDFRDVVLGDEKILEDEKNLLYVAMTRAKKYLALNSVLVKLLLSSQQHFEKVIIANSIESTRQCSQCENSLADEDIFCLQRSSFSVDEIFQRKGGILCSLCAGSTHQVYSMENHGFVTEWKLDDRHRSALRFFVGPLGKSIQTFRHIHGQE